MSRGARGATGGKAGTREVAMEEAGGEPCFVCPRHERLARDCYARAERFRGVLLALLAAIVVGVVLSAMLESAIGTGVALAGGGIGAFLLPFGTPQTVQMHGVRASIWIARALSLLVVALGAMALAAAPG
ncbi:MAG TPA: hypothetical protein VHG08_21675 [Longimicrobium sp.]|nr:hypothetical protein [Longimicrobium sp.]